MTAAANLVEVRPSRRGEGVMAKAARLLTSGAVTIEAAGVRSMLLRVVGDSGTYEVVRRRGGWSCSCPCYGRCSHLTAAMLLAGSSDRRTA